MEGPLKFVELGIVAFVGTLFTAVGIGTTVHALRQQFTWPKVPARVRRYVVTRSRDNLDGQRFFHVVVQFDTLDGRTTTAVSSFGYWRRRWARGVNLAVRYDPRNPRHAEVASLRDTWSIPVLVVGMLGGLSIWKFWLDPLW
jgi:hypothetical protein